MDHGDHQRFRCVYHLVVRRWAKLPMDTWRSSTLGVVSTWHVAQCSSTRATLVTWCSETRSYTVMDFFGTVRCHCASGNYDQELIFYQWECRIFYFWSIKGLEKLFFWLSLELGLTPDPELHVTLMMWMLILGVGGLRGSRTAIINLNYLCLFSLQLWWWFWLDFDWSTNTNSTHRTN